MAALETTKLADGRIARRLWSDAALASFDPDTGDPAVGLKRLVALAADPGFGPTREFVVIPALRAEEV